MSKLTERVAQALFDLDQQRPYTQLVTNELLFGIKGRAVTWAELNGPNVVRSASDEYREKALTAIDATRSALKASEFKRGPDGGHGERPTPSLDEIFHVAMGWKL